MTDSTHGTAVRSRFAADLQSTVSIAIRFADCALVALVAIVAYWLRHDTFMLPGHYLAAVLLAVALTAQFLQSTERYEFPRLLHVMPQISRLSGGWSAVILALIAIAFLTKTSDELHRGRRLDHAEQRRLEALARIVDLAALLVPMLVGRDGPQKQILAGVEPSADRRVPILEVLTHGLGMAAYIGPQAGAQRMLVPVRDGAQLR